MGRTIRDCLDKMKRQALANLGFRLNLPPPGSRKTLDAWRDMAAAALPELGATVRECLGYKGLVRLGKCLSLAAEEDGALRVDRETALACRAQLELGLLKRIALAWQDRRGWLVQPIVPDMLRMERGERGMLEASDDLYLCTRGYLMHFGMLPVKSVQQMLLGREDARAENVVLAVYARRCGLDGVVFMPGDSVWLCLPELPDPSELAAEVMRPDRLMIEYAKVTEAMARAAAKDGLTGDRGIAQRLAEAARRCGVRKGLAMTDLSIAEGMYQQGDREMAMQTALAHFDEKRLPVGQLLADHYFNTVPVWHVKGHTVNETHDAKPKQHVGWYAPCPCGSGRSWGTCCGRGQ